MQSWKQCDLPVITSMASSQLMHLAHDEQSCNGTSCAEGLISHIVIVVASRAHCFHDCINLVLRAILRNSSLSSYSEKMCWGRRFITTAQSVNLFMQMLLVVNQCKLHYNSKIQCLIRFVFDWAVVVNFRSKIQINRIFDIWIKYLLQFTFNHFMYLFYLYRLNIVVLYSHLKIG